jgi:hypothetical protein
MIRCIGKAGARHPSWIYCPKVQISKAGWPSISLPNDATLRGTCARRSMRQTLSFAPNLEMASIDPWEIWYIVHEREDQGRSYLIQVEST